MSSLLALLLLFAPASANEAICGEIAAELMIAVKEDLISKKEAAEILSRCSNVNFEHT